MCVQYWQLFDQHTEHKQSALFQQSLTTAHTTDNSVMAFERVFYDSITYH
jgi:hypothetical protein